MAQKLKVHYIKPLYSCVDRNYYSFIYAIKQYLLNYNVFTFATTMEGALINSNTYSYAMNFLRKRNSETDFNDFKSYIEAMKDADRINLLRIVFQGKSDLLKSYKKQIKKELMPNQCLIIERVMIEGKACGWISEYIDEFIKTIIPNSDESTPRVFKKYLESDENAIKVRKEIMKNFPEIDSIMKNIVV